MTIGPFQLCLRMVLFFGQADSGDQSLQETLQLIKGKAASRKKRKRAREIAEVLQMAIAWLFQLFNFFNLGYQRRSKMIKDDQNRSKLIKVYRSQSIKENRAISGILMHFIPWSCVLCLLIQSCRCF